MTNTILNIATFPGDGIGPDVINSAIQIIEKTLTKVGNLNLNWNYIKAGATYYQETGMDVEPDGEKKASEADAIFLGAIGLPTVRKKDGTEIAPHLRFREIFNLYAGVRPVKAYKNTPQRLSEINAEKIDFVVLRECTEGLFYTAAVHNRNKIANNDEVEDIMRITRNTTTRLHNFAFKLAEKRKKKR